MRLLHEPLLHFLLIGALLFGADAARRNDDAPAPQVIEITAAEVARLQPWWSKQKGRAVTAEELRGLIEGHVREEVLYREALAMGLDRDDSIIRRRLAQKLEFLIEDLAAARGPSDAELGAFFEGRRESYQQQARVSFSQVFFSPDRRGRATEADANLVLAGLRAGTVPAAAAADQGDRFMMGEFYSEQSPQDIEAVFGPEFARALFEVAPGDGWSGPIASSHGWHLVGIEARSAGQLPMLAEVADQVRQDWSYEQRQEVNAAVIDRLLARYELVIEDGALSQSAAATFELDAEGQP